MSEIALSRGGVAPNFHLLDPVAEQRRPIFQRERPTLLTFLRGTWCPTCRAFLDRVTPLHPELAGRGIDVVGVVCQGRQWVASWLKVNPLPFPLLVDETREVAKAYGVYKLMGLDGVNIARPATFLVDASGAIVWEHIGSHPLDRPSNDELRQVLAAV